MSEQIDEVICQSKYIRLFVRASRWDYMSEQVDEVIVRANRWGYMSEQIDEVICQNK
jgi:hypothetical protein